MKTQSILFRSSLRLFGTSTLRRCLLADHLPLVGARPHTMQNRVPFLPATATLPPACSDCPSGRP